MNKRQGQDSINLYQQSFQASSQYAYILDLDGHLVDCNQNLLKALGIEALKTHAVGAIYKLMLDNQFGNEQQLLQLKEKDIRLLMGEAVPEDDQPMPLLINKKTTHHFQIIRRPLTSEAQERTGLLVTFRDISEELILKEQLEKVKAELAHENAKIGDKGAYSSTTLYSGIENEDMSSPVVLLIEDDPLAQKAAKSVLLHCNFEVYTASNEEEFHQIFTPGKFDVVLVDIGLEETSGYMIAKSIRKQEKDSEFHVPIIAVTGYDPEHLLGDCAHYSIEGAIQKPLTISQAAQINQRYIKHIDIEIMGLALAQVNRNG